MLNIKIKKIVEYLLYVFVFLIPWQTRYIYKYLSLNEEIFEYGKLSFYFSELVLIVLIVLALFLKTKKLSKIHWITIAFLVISFLGFFTCLDYSLYFYGLIKLIEAVLLFLILGKINFNIIKVGIAFVSSVFIHSILGAIQFFSQSIFANKYLGIAEQVSSQGGVSVLEGSFGRLLRAYGGFSHPNIFGGFLVIAILFCLIIYFHKSKKSVLFWFVLIFLFNVLVLTFSRSAWLALVLSFLGLFIYSLYKKEIFKKVLPVLMIGFLVFRVNFVLFNDFLRTRIQAQERLELKSSIDRMVLKEQALSLLKDNWVLGTGINNYILTVYKNINQDLNTWEYQPVHNVYLLVFIELGVLGVILYICLLLYFLYQAFSSRDLIKFILGLMLFSIIIINFWDHYFYTYWSGLIIMFLIIGLLNNKKSIDFN